MLDRTKRLLRTPDKSDPHAFLLEVLRSLVELLSLPDNDFAWSSWSGRDVAVSEVESIIALIESGKLPDRVRVAVLFAPTGPAQEVSLSSGWADVFLKVAELYDQAEEMLWHHHLG